MSTIRIGTTAFASITDALMAAKADSLILLGSGLFVPTSLAGSAAPRVTLKGAGPVNGTTLRNARVFDQGLDGGTLPLGFTIQDLRFDYTSGAQGAILLAPTATGLTLQNLALTGPHKGAVGAEGTYINLSGSKNSTLSGLDVSLSAQAGYDPLTGIGGGAFLLFAGGDNLQILNSRFQEGGYGNSMQVLFTGNARIVGNQFSGGGVTKQVSPNNPRSERFYNAGGLFSGNTLSAGAFFDFQFNRADPSAIWADYKNSHPAADGTFQLRTSLFNNSFTILSGGQGILIRSDAPAGVVQAMLSIRGNTFTNGVAIRSRLATPSELVFGPNTIDGHAFNQLRVGGDGHDQLNRATPSGLKRWLSGGGGNDQLYGTPGSFDAFVFAAPLNAQTNLDTIYGFETGGLLPDQLWLDRAIFFGLQSANGVLGAASFSANGQGAASTALPQITFNTTTGLVAFDPDGNGLLGATAFARLNGKESLSAQQIRLFGTAAVGPPPLLTISATSANQAEGNTGTTAFTFTVTRTGDTSGSSSALWSISGSGANPATAVDFGGAFPTGTISFAAGQTSQTLTVLVSGESTFEPEETFLVSLSSPAGASLNLAAASATGTIVNDDDPAAGLFTLSMLKDGPGGSSLSITPLITVGEACNGLVSGGSAYLPPGRLDGMGAYDNGDGTITLLVNHELGGSEGAPINLRGLNPNATGARISRFVIAKDGDNNPANGFQARVLQGGLAFDDVKSVDPAFAKGGLTRLCSANLSQPLQFGNGRGFVDRLSFCGEEGGQRRFFALAPTSADLHHLPALGRGGWESGVAVDTGSANTVALMLFDDTSGTANYLYLWVGTKDPSSGDLLRRNGIDASSGALYAWKAETINNQAGPNTVALNTAVAGHWERLGSGSEIAALSDASQLRALALSKGAMPFIRIEDGDVNPNTGKQVAFNTTGGSGADLYGNTNVIDLNHAFAADGSLRTSPDTSSLRVVVDADRLTGVARQSGVRNPDNIVWARNGKLYIQEDRAVPGGTADGQFGSQEASIWEVDPLIGSKQRWAQIDRSAVPSAYGQTDRQVADVGNWEPSGLIEVSHLFGAPAGTVFFSTVMAHNLTDGRIGGPTALVEGGQIQLIQTLA